MAPTADEDAPPDAGAGEIPRTDPLAVLAAFRLADSALPVGSDTVSFGLEQFVETGEVTDGAELRALLESYLARQVGPADMIALRVAHAAACDGDVDGVVRADRRLRAVTLPAEFRESATRSGRRLLDLATAVLDDPVVEAHADRVHGDGDAPGNYVAGLGAVTARVGIDAETACLVHGHAFVSGLLGAGQRLLGLGHTDLQRIGWALRPAIAAAADHSRGRDLGEMAPFAPLIEIAACEHERADRRLFVS
jgi:urease accessory protein